jgi:hypothetical protein
LPLEDPCPLAVKQQVVDLLKSLETKNPVPFAYVNPNKYIQHNLQVGPGPAGAAALIQNMPPETFPSYFNRIAYIQHDPWVADTIPGLIAGLQALAAKGRAVVYKRVHMGTW